MNNDISQLKDQALVQWIGNRLSDSNEQWTGRYAASFLTKDVLIELETCFQSLEPHIKLKIIQGIAHLSPRLVQKWKTPIKNLIKLAQRDADEWVEAIADMYRDFAEQGCIRCIPSNPESNFFTTLDELNRLVKERINQPSVPLILPPNAELLTHTAIKAKYGYEMANSSKKHFTVKSQTKLKNLLEDLKKAGEQQSNPMCRKNQFVTSSSFPIKMKSWITKKTINNLPMSKIPTVNTCKISGGFTNEPKKFQRQLTKREGGAMLIDFNELPQPNNKRRKKAEGINETTPKSQQPNKKAIKNEKNSKKATSNEIKNDAELLNPTSASNTLINSSYKINQQNNSIPIYNSLNSTQSIISSQNSIFQCASEEQALTSQIESLSTFKQQPNGMQLFSDLSLQQLNTNNNTNTNFLNNYENQLKQQNSLAMNSISEQNNISSTNTTTSSTIVSKHLEDLLKDANKLTTASYNLITSFLSGNRSNPLNNKIGPIVILPLSENVEYEQKQNPLNGEQIIVGNLVQTFFQIDYDSGEWKKLKKTRILQANEF